MGISLADYWSTRPGTAAGLLALNEVGGRRYYELPPAAAEDRAAADEALGGDQLVVDVQTHYVSDRPEAMGSWNSAIADMYRAVQP